jgi:protein TonB
LATVREGVSADGLREYRVSLAIAARRFKRYPVLALERGWEGTVDVAVSMTSWQQRPQPALVRSSGHAALDEQALSMVEQASLVTVLPDSLKGRDFGFVLPIEFIRENDR